MGNHHHNRPHQVLGWKSKWRRDVYDDNFNIARYKENAKGFIKEYKYLQLAIQIFVVYCSY